MVSRTFTFSKAKNGQIKNRDTSNYANDYCPPQIKSDSLNRNYATLQKDMQDMKLAAAIERNIGLATSLNITGTPAYLVGDQFISGAIDAESFEKVVAAQRAKIAKVKTFNGSSAGPK